MGGWLVGWAERADCGERGWRKGNEQNEGEKESNGLARHPVRHVVVARGRGETFEVARQGRLNYPSLKTFPRPPPGRWNSFGLARRSYVLPALL